MDKIQIIGNCGSGKSVLAVELGKLLDIEVTHLDSLFWLPGWTARPREEFVGLIEKAMTGQRWIIDGGYNPSLKFRIAASDTIIWLEFPRWLCLWRVLKRAFLYRGRTRGDMGEGCREKIDLEFIRWILDYPRRRKEIQKLLEEYDGDIRVLKFYKPAEVKRFLEEL